MTAGTAQILRRAGLLVELLAMAGLVARSRGGAAFLDGLPVDPSTALAGLLIAGFGAWLVGTLNLLALRHRRRDETP
jgi:hypothetical protein